MKRLTFAQLRAPVVESANSTPFYLGKNPSQTFGAPYERCPDRADRILAAFGSTREEIP